MVLISQIIWHFLVNTDQAYVLLEQVQKYLLMAKHIEAISVFSIDS